MKNRILTLFLFLSAAILTYSCTSVNEVVRPVCINVSKGTLTFTPDTLTRTLEVIATEGVDWQISYADKWLDIDCQISPDNDTTTVTVTAEAFEEDDVRTGKIVFAGEGVANVTVRISQIGDIPEVPEPDVIWDRSARSRLNLKGRVKTVSVLTNFLSEVEMIINDVQFDKRGNITSFKSTGYTGDQSYTASYDNENRLAKFVQAFDGGEAVAEFHYSDHGIYIPTGTLFYELSYSVYTYHEIWIPEFIHNLESITYERTGETPGEFLYHIDRTSNTGTLSGSGYHDLVIDGNYVTKVISHYSGFTDNFDQYTVNQSNGNLVRKQNGVTEAGTDYAWNEFIYNDDYLNTLDSRSTSADYSTYTCTYNENMDLISLESKDKSYSFTISYEYDSMGNWTKATKDNNGNVTVFERTITYW